jgi:hypothetical protein
MRILFAVDILCEPDIIFPWIAEPEKAMLWQRDVKKGEIIEETPEKIGITFREEMSESGNSIEMLGEITGYVRNELITFHLESKIHTLDVSYSIVGNNYKSTVTVESIIYWKFPMNLLGMIIGGKMKKGILKQTELEFSELKRLCETEQ